MEGIHSELHYAEFVTHLDVLVAMRCLPVLNPIQFEVGI